MKPSSPAVIGLAVAVFTAFGVTHAFSQGAPPVSGGLFGGRSAPDSRHKLDFSFGLVEGYNSDTASELQSVDPLAAISGGYTTLLTGSGNYSWQGSRIQVGATGASTFRYFSRLEEIKTFTHTFGLGVSTRLGSRTTFLANQTAAYSPAFLYGLFPQQAEPTVGDAIPAAPDYVTTNTESYAYGSSLSLVHSLTRRSRLTVSGDFHYTDFPHESELYRDVSHGGVGAGLSRNLSRNSSLNAKYRYRTGSFYGQPNGEGDLTTTEHSVDVGVSFSRPLSPTRRFTSEFNFGASSLHTPHTPLSGETELAVASVYRFTAEASAAYQFANRLVGRGTYRRGLVYVAGLTQPVFMDGLTVGVDGLLGRRLDFGASARYAAGEWALHRDQLNLKTYSADVRLRYAIISPLAVYGEYIYYFYDTGRDVAVSPVMTGDLKRHAVRVGLTVWVTALRK